MNLKMILELSSVGVFSIWAVITEVRMRAITARNEALAYEVKVLQNEKIVKSESDAVALAEFKANLGSGSN